MGKTPKNRDVDIEVMRVSLGQLLILMGQRAGYQIPRSDELITDEHSSETVTLFLARGDRAGRQEEERNWFSDEGSGVRATRLAVIARTNTGILS